MLALRFARAAVVVPLLGAALSGCGSPAAGADGAVAVVASTDVYGNLAASLGGDAVAVTSLLSGAGQDPHSYEASAHDELALSKAAVVVENGGGYDEFVGELLAAAGSHPSVLDAVEISGHAAPPAGSLNEHVWYDLSSMRRLVTALSRALSSADPSHASTFAANARHLAAGLGALQRIEAQLRSRYGGTGVAITEPVPLYLLDACGLVNRTPPQFSEALEEDTGVGVALLHDTLQLFSDHRVRALVYNAQTSGPETDAVIGAAKDAGIATVPVTETLPEGKGYLAWMHANLTALARALGGPKP
ncbi:MAG: zinc/manganese transport system substrate-binding protein [Pseudonocardiales bacterium]|nr:zinc/manganese transport system substrate-binding protein [Pseudonocardiales bacterium]